MYGSRILSQDQENFLFQLRQYIPPALQGSPLKKLDRDIKREEEYEIIDKIEAMGPEVIPTVISYLDREVLPDLSIKFPGGSVSTTQHPEGRRICSLVLANCGEAAAKPVVEKLNSRLRNELTSDYNVDYYEILAMIGAPSIKPIAELAQSKDAATSKIGMKILLSVLNKASEYCTRERPYIPEFQGFRPAECATRLRSAIPPKYCKYVALRDASRLYVKVLKLYSKSVGDQRLLMPEAVRCYAAVLEARGKHDEATAMQAEFSSTGTLTHIPR
jgi:hypothetical protein